MRTQVARILTGLTALVAAGINAESQRAVASPPPEPGPGDLPPSVHYTWTTLDDPLATDSAAVGFGTYATGIWGDSIVGGYADSEGKVHGFLYNQREKTWTTLDDPDGDGTFCENISGDNIFGQYADASGNTYGFLYNGRTWTSFADPDADPAYGTTLYGLVSHQFFGNYLDANADYHGFLYDPYSQTWTTLDDPLAGSLGTDPQDSEGDLIVGVYADPDFVLHGFLYSLSDKTWVTLDDPSAGSATYQGTQLVGISGYELTGFYTDSTGLNHGFVYDGRTWTTLDAPLAGTASGQGTFGQYSWNGQVTGAYVDSAGLQHGFLATPSFGSLSGP
jgi:hypothetical protein